MKVEHIKKRKHMDAITKDVKACVDDFKNKIQKLEEKNHITIYNYNIGNISIAYDITYLPE